jgi:hypothetical protein
MNQSVCSALFTIFDEFRSRNETLSPRMLAKRISEQRLSLSAYEEIARQSAFIGGYPPTSP